MESQVIRISINKIQIAEYLSLFKEYLRSIEQII